MKILKKNINPPRIHVFFDLDETLISGPNHWKAAAGSAIHALTNHELYKNSDRVFGPAYLSKFQKWDVSQARQIKKELNELTGKKFNNQQAFLFKVLRDDIYNRNPNDLKQFDKLLKKVHPYIKNKNIKPLVKTAVDAYHLQTEKNIQDGVLSSNPGALNAIKTLLDLGATVSIATKGYFDRQERKVNDVLLKDNSSLRGKIPIFTTEKNFLWVRRVGEKTPGFYQSLKRKIKANKSDFLVYIGDRHDSDVIPAKKAGFFTIHIPGRKDIDYLKGIKESRADIISPDLDDAIKKLREKIVNTNRNIN